LQSSGYSVNWRISESLRWFVVSLPSCSLDFNLSNTPENVPDVIVAPSHYAVGDASVVRAKKVRNDPSDPLHLDQEFSSLVAVVIPPGVDLTRFQRAALPTNALLSERIDRPKVERWMVFPDDY
jgi:hypothetical protein